jgi:hypothetical protein
MEFQIYSPNNDRKRWVLIGAVFAFSLFCSWDLYDRGFVSGNSEEEAFLKNLLWIFVALVLPWTITVGMTLRKAWGISWAAGWLSYSIVLTEIQIVFWGPSLISPKGFAVLSLMVILVYGIGPRQLWNSLWVKPSAIDRRFPAWFNRTIISKVWEKRIFLTVYIIAQAMILFAFIYVGERVGFFYPPFTQRVVPASIPSKAITLCFPFGFQMNVPPSATLFDVSPKYGSLELEVDGKLWRIEKNYHFNDILQSYSSGPKGMERFLGERFGVIPKVIKSLLFGERPEDFFEIKVNDLWCVVSVEKIADEKFKKVKVVILDVAGNDLGFVGAELDPSRPPDLDWIYSIRRTPETKAEEFMQKAKRDEAEGNACSVEMDLASAVIIEKDPTLSLKKLIEYQRDHGALLRARRLLRMAKFEYPYNPEFKAILLEKKKGK